MDATIEPQTKCMDVDAADSGEGKGFTEVKARRPWRRAFLAALRIDGNVTKACEVAGISLVMAYRIRNRSSRFKEAWSNAKKIARRRYIDKAEAACESLGIDGYLEPVYQGGVLVGEKRRFIPDLIKFRLAGESPRKYSRKTETTVQSHVSIQVHQAQARFLDPAVMLLACQLDEAMAAIPQASSVDSPTVQDVVSVEQEQP